MKQFNWKFTQYAEFNESDSLLLVSGGHFGKFDDTSGEIAIFSLDGLYFFGSQIKYCLRAGFTFQCSNNSLLQFKYRV